MEEFPNHPYRTLSARAFWRGSVGSRHYADLTDLWSPVSIKQSDRIATAGSCFAQHIGNSLARRGANFIDMEPPPSFLAQPTEARRWGYGLFSCRYGNIYTARQLVQLFDEAFGVRCPEDRVWERHGRFFDALRPSTDPVGQATAEAVLALRERHLLAVKRMFVELDLFVFTLGLTEAWEAIGDGTVYPSAPGVVAGRYRPESYRFCNFRYVDVMRDMVGFWERLRAVNPSARMLLTVSPVPLAATASDNHVLVANTYSKSVLRAVAGDLACDFEEVHYFPSYEIVASHPSRAMFFDPGLRDVNVVGVDFVMKHFFSGGLMKEFERERSDSSSDLDLELICDEALTDP